MTYNVFGGTLNLMQPANPKWICCKNCKQFLPHLNNISTLPCETWPAHRKHFTIELLQEETTEFCHLNYCLKNLPDLNPVDNNVWEIVQEMVYKAGITDLKLSTMPLTNSCRKTTWSCLTHFVLRRCFSFFISLMHVLYTFSCNSPHML